MNPTANVGPTIAENYEKLMPVVERLYNHMDQVAHIALLPLFLLSVLMAFSQDLGVEGAIVSRLKRLVTTAIILVAFPSLTGMIKNFGQEVALSIDNLQGIDAFLKAAGTKASSYSASVKSLLDFGNDLIVSLLVTISYIFLYMARYLLVAFYHFYWMILVVTGPFLILGNLFESTSVLTKNLFKNLILVACWPIVWAILSAFLTALPFQDVYNIEGGYTAVIVMNLILAVSLLFSPFMLGQFCEGTIIGAGSGMVSAGARAVTAFVAPKMALAAQKTQGRIYPAVSRYIPSKQTLYKAASKLSGKNGVLVFLIIPFFASAESINVRPGLSSVLCFEKQPDSIAIGDGRYFQAQKLGKNLLLRSTLPNKETNLLVFSGGTLSASFRLYSDPVMPHIESRNCEKSITAQKKETTRKSNVEKIYSSSEKSGIRVELLRKAWESDKRDYFTLRLRLKNNSPATWAPNWSAIVLKQDSKSFKHTGLSSERKDIVSGASVTFDIQFTRPEIAKNRSTLVIPSNFGELSILVEKGAKN